MIDPQRVLIVEDNASMRRTLTIFLEQAGFDVVAVVEFQRALQLIRGELFDTLVPDLDLPGGTGLALHGYLEKPFDRDDLVASLKKD